VGNPGGPCAKCSLSKFGSGKNNGQACKLTRALFVAVPGRALPLVVKCPPTSVKKVNEYLTNLTAATKSYYNVITSFKLGTDKNRTGIVYSVIKPSVVGDVPEEHLQTVKDYRNRMLPKFKSATISDD
jgi:hypothetical protein